jgi:hypothetical protein
LDTQVYVHTHSPPSLATIIGIPTYQSPDIYTVVFKDGSLAEYTESILSLVPEVSVVSSSSLLPSWIKWVRRLHCFYPTCLNPVMER